jgi:hypothetical protein
LEINKTILKILSCYLKKHGLLVVEGEELNALENDYRNLQKYFKDLSAFGIRKCKRY